MKSGLECLMNALRLKDGMPTAAFLQRTGLPLDAVAKTRAKSPAAGFITGG